MHDMESCILKSRAALSWGFESESRRRIAGFYIDFEVKRSIDYTGLTCSREMSTGMSTFIGRDEQEFLNPKKRETALKG